MRSSVWLPVQHGWCPCREEKHGQRQRYAYKRALREGTQKESHLQTIKDHSHNPLWEATQSNLDIEFQYPKLRKKILPPKTCRISAILLGWIDAFVEWSDWDQNRRTDASCSWFSIRMVSEKKWEPGSESGQAAWELSGPQPLQSFYHKLSLHVFLL